MEGLERRPPEGGWGYFVIMGMSICLILTIGILPCIGLLFGDFLALLGQGTQTIALLNSTFFMSSSVAGLMLNPLLKSFAIRSVGIAVACIFFAGSLLVVYANSVLHLLLAFGIMQGVGFGIMSSIAFATFNEYFMRKRIFMMGLAQTLVGLGSMGLPLLIVMLMELYGFRGCLAVLAAINAHVLLAMMVMHPVGWHARRARVEALEHIDATHRLVSMAPDHEREDDSNNNHLDSALRALPIRRSKTASLISVDDHSIPNDINLSSNTGWRAIINFLDFGLLADSVYVNISVGMSLALYSDITFFTFQPLYLVELGYTKSAAAQIISIGASTDLLARFVLGVSSSCIPMTARLIFLIGALATIATRFAFQYVREYLAMAVVTGILGFFRAFLHIPIALVIAEYLPGTRYPSGQGLFMFMQGCIVFILGPCVGWVRDYTRSYALTFHCLTVAMAICAVPWTVELAWLRYRKNFN